MRICALLEKRARNGTYVGVTFNKGTVNRLSDFVKKHKIANPLDPSKYHTTVIYSRVHCPDLKAHGGLAEGEVVGVPTGFNVWKTQEGTHALVLEYKCEWLANRHQSLMEEHGATYDFPKYNPHITLSYDVGDDFDPSGLDPKDIGPIDIVYEYTEDLDLEWGK